MTNRLGRSSSDNAGSWLECRCLHPAKTLDPQLLSVLRYAIGFHTQQITRIPEENTATQRFTNQGSGEHFTDLAFLCSVVSWPARVLFAVSVLALECLDIITVVFAADLSES